MFVNFIIIYFHLFNIFGKLFYYINVTSVRILLIFVFLLSLIHINGSFSSITINYSTYKKSLSKQIKNNSQNQNQTDISDIGCFFAFSDRAQCRVRRLSDLEICEIIRGFKRGLDSYENYYASLKEINRRGLECVIEWEFQLPKSPNIIQ